jgi:hypothetical protein
MRTTVRLNDTLLKDVKRLAAEKDTTLTALIEEALREKLARQAVHGERKPFKLRTFDGGGVQPGVDLDNNALVRDIMDGLA